MACAQIVAKNSAECYYVGLISPGSVLHNHRTVVQIWDCGRKAMRLQAYVGSTEEMIGASFHIRFRVSGFGFRF